MRQTLLRIRLDDAFSLEPIHGITAIGVGWFAMVVLPMFGYWLARNRKVLATGNQDALMTAVLGGGLCTAMMTAPFWASPNGFVPVYGYGFMLFVGFLTAAWWAGTRSRAVGLPDEVIWDSCMWLFFGGILGARLFFLIQKHETVFAETKGPVDVIKKIVNLPDGGLVLFGGILLGSVCFAAYCIRKKLSGLLVADVLIPSFFVGLGFGRLGCFMNGCCFGDACGLPWAVTFPTGSVPHEALVTRGIIPEYAVGSIPLHPTQVYSALNSFLLAGLFHAYFRYRPSNGSVVALALMTYPITRFLIEYLRADELGQLNTSLTISQLGSIGLVAAGIGLQIWLTFQEREPATPPPANAPTA